MTTAKHVLAFITQNSLHTYKRLGSRASLPAQHEAYVKDKEKQGVVFVSRSKEDLQEARGYVVTSYETLLEQNEELTHWTPNTFLWGSYADNRKRIFRGHRKENLKQVNTIVLDIDTKKTDPYAMFLACEEEGLPAPSVIIETPRGYHVYFVLDAPMFIRPDNDYKALTVAERISENMKQALATHIPVDTACNPFGFFRVPTDENVLYQAETKVSVARLLTWSKDYEDRRKRGAFHVVYGGGGSRQIDQPWYQELLQCRHITSGHYTSSRNNTILTLAIANYASGRSYEDAYDELDEFNSRLEHPMRLQEFTRTVKSAYSGRYKGAKRSYIDMLLLQWTGEASEEAHVSGWYKFKKERSERERSHYDEWEADILEYLKEHTSATSPSHLFIEGSQKELADRLGMAVSTLKEVLKRSRKVKKIVKGKGRRQRTYLANRAVLFSYLLHVRKAYVARKQEWRDMYQVIGEEDYPVRMFLRDLYQEFREWVSTYEQHFRHPWIC
ncbi:primase C-terminal domain-containing protein [Salimicrobium halophilum]|uniref:Primase C terminal 1 (PriCT-1) n=1 Tax=Salimicrobium halophilum TaxID=86666 RepID=A0A1G8W4U0_9BACI|nr:primase C-terminal domain-containing protein [Salimicrobium halophilum]SDJ73318.1 Primase C terminal 1 (PriCT-1) [Salimicrobium halophilum]